MPRNYMVKILAKFSEKVNGLHALIKGLVSRIKNHSQSNELQRIKELEEIYSSIPEISCVENCGKCCGLISMSKLEEKRIRRFLEENHLNIQFYNDPLDVTYMKAVYGNNRCYFLDEDQRCLIYPIRPIICRLYGVAENMKCPHSRPEEYLTEQESHRLIKEVKNI